MTTPSVKGTTILSNLSILSFLQERIRLRHRSGHGRSPRRPFFFLVLLAGECHIQSLPISSNSSPTPGPTTHGLQTIPISAQDRPSNPNTLQPSWRHQLASSVGTTVPLQIKLIPQLLMGSTRNTSRSNANPLRMQNLPGDADSRPLGTIEAMQANTNEVEALRLVNQRLIEELEQLTRQMKHPRETR